MSVSNAVPRLNSDELCQAFTVNEFIYAYRIGRTRLYQLINAGELRAVKVGRRTYILKADADRWAASLPALV